MLDTCVLIHAEKTDAGINLKKWESYDEVFISAITVSELLVGVHRTDSEARRLKRSAFVEAVIKTIPVIDFTHDAARIHAEMAVVPHKQRQPIGAHDLIIAATAMTHGHALLTANRKEFIRVPGLKVLDMFEQPDQKPEFI